MANLGVSGRSTIAFAETRRGRRAITCRKPSLSGKPGTCKHRDEPTPPTTRPILSLQILVDSSFGPKKYSLCSCLSASTFMCHSLFCLALLICLPRPDGLRRIFPPQIDARPPLASRWVAMMQDFLLRTGSARLSTFEGCVCGSFVLAGRAEALRMADPCEFVR